MNKHFNIYLQRAFNILGIDNTNIELLEECEKEALCEREIFHIKEHKSNNSKYGFNLTSGGEKFEMNQDVKQRISKKHIGKIVSQSLRTKGKPKSEEFKQKLRDYNKRKKQENGS